MLLFDKNLFKGLWFKSLQFHLVFQIQIPALAKFYLHSRLFFEKFWLSSIHPLKNRVEKSSQDGSSYLCRLKEATLIARLGRFLSISLDWCRLTKLPLSNKEGQTPISSLHTLHWLHNKSSNSSFHQISS